MDYSSTQATLKPMRIGKLYCTKRYRGSVITSVTFKRRYPIQTKHPFTGKARTLTVTHVLKELL